MSGGGGETITQENQVSPYAPSEPYLNNILTEASNLYQSGTGSQYYPGSTVVPFAQQTQNCTLIDLNSFRNYPDNATILASYEPTLCHEHPILPSKNADPWWR